MSAVSSVSAETRGSGTPSLPVDTFFLKLLIRLITASLLGPPGAPEARRSSAGSGPSIGLNGLLVPAPYLSQMAVIALSGCCPPPWKGRSSLAASARTWAWHRPGASRQVRILPLSSCLARSITPGLLARCLAKFETDAALASSL